jgi:L-iditol 2-dehydrogenase
MKMKALLKDSAGVRVTQVARPEICLDDDVLIRVALAGLCRTDLYVAQGLIPCESPLILGHEFSGVIIQVGSNVVNLSPGQRVAVMPLIPCMNCKECLSGNLQYCLRSSMLGLERDGAFAEYIVVPARAVYPLPKKVSFKLGAYAEPVAAAMAVLNTGIRPERRGLIYGNGRIAQLTERVLRTRGFVNISCYNPFKAEVPPEKNSYDFLIETVAGQVQLDDMITALVPCGKLILKSRTFQPVSINLSKTLKKEITFQAVNYGSFNDAIILLAQESFNIDDLLGEIYSLEEFSAVFQAARFSEQSKPFFYMDEAYVRDF